MKKLLIILVACATVSLGYAQESLKVGAKKQCTAAQKASCKASKASCTASSLTKTASLEAEGYEVSKCAKSGSLTASKTCSASGKVTTVETCGKTGKTVKTIADKEGNLVTREVISGEAVSKNAATTDDKAKEVSEDGASNFNADDLMLQGYAVKSCASSGSTTAKKTCAASGKVTKIKKSGEGVVTKTVTDADGVVLSTEVLEEATAEVGSLFNFANLEGEGFEMKSCASSGSKYASKTCATSGKTTDYKMCGTSGKVTKTVKDKEGAVLASEIVSNGKADNVEALEMKGKKKACCASKSAKSCGSKKVSGK